jgi:ribosomal protein L22
MSPERASTPEQGKPEAEKAELEAAEAKEKVAKASEPPAKATAAEKDPNEKKLTKAKAAEAKPAAKKPAAKKKTAPVEKADSEPKGDAAKPKPPAKPKSAAAAKAETEEPAPQPTIRAKAAPPPRRKLVRAQARYVRTSARKARMVCGHLRGKSVAEARAILAFTPREVARDWSKLLESAVANAENNHELVEEDLFVREAFADEGPTIKRFQPRAQGRATPIRKRTSHLTITLTPRA